MSVIRTLMPTKYLQTSGKAALEGKNKVVLIVGASRGIGFNVLKQYANDPDTVIIAASKSIESIRKAVIDLGDTPAIIQCAEIDLTASKKQLVDSIKSLDKQYGPITHLYEVSGISNHLKDSSAWGLDVTSEMINVNVSGTVTSVLTMYELMKSRGYGKICVVGSVAGLYSPANMISYASTKAFINTFSTSLRVLAAPCGVDVVTVQPGFIDTRMTKMMRGQGSTVPGREFASAAGMAKCMKDAVEHGGVGVVSWPVRQSVQMYALKAVNPICEEFGKWASMKLGMSGKKIT
ncbi:putative oxidoreductase YxjF [Psilocybe cubensis]|uniref:Oxidoreductase YxjF n=2 Tax=Psilocybe cubensis TaxID=181762 RepID=A0ACB8GLF0_PSICU|nr:putative oxidoreductase YxjF [Psilocybe cubensis]KAH9476371.1 putative oxidoreductase YxjF [Psilocybe cubensis]